MKRVVLPQNVVAATLNYLASKPFREVAGLMQELSASVPFKENNTHVADGEAAAEPAGKPAGKAKKAAA